MNRFVAKFAYIPVYGQGWKETVYKLSYKLKADFSI